MAIRVKHSFVSGKPDGGDETVVQPSNWNADHTVEGLGSAAEADVGDFATAAQGALADTAVQPSALGDVAGLDKADAAATRASTTDRPLVADNLVSANAIVTLTDAGTIAINWSTFINATVTLGGNRTLGLPSNGVPGQWRYIDVVQDGTGNRTLAFASGYQFPDKEPPTLTEDSGARDKLAIFCRTSSIFEVHAALNIGAP